MGDTIDVGGTTVEIRETRDGFEAFEVEDGWLDELEEAAEEVFGPFSLEGVHDTNEDGDFEHDAIIVVETPTNVKSDGDTFDPIEEVADIQYFRAGGGQFGQPDGTYGIDFEDGYLYVFVGEQ